jgi:signal transduction histidine kinase
MTRPVAAGLHAAVAGLASLLPTARVSIVARIGEDTLRVLASSDDERVGDLLISLDRYPELVHVLATGEPLLISQVARSPLLTSVRGPLNASGITSIAAVPFMLDGLPLILRTTSHESALHEPELALITAASHLLTHAAESRLAERQDEAWSRLCLRMADAVIDIAPDGRILRAFGRPAAIFGELGADIIGRHVAELIHFGDRARAWSRIQDMLEADQPLPYVPYELTTSSRPNHRFSAFGVPVHPLVPHLRVALRALDDNSVDAPIERLMGAIPVPTLLLDDHGRVLRANPAAARLLGRPPEEIITLQLSHLLHHPTGTTTVPGPGGHPLPVKAVEGAVDDSVAPRWLVGLIDLRPFADAQKREERMRTTLRRQIEELEQAHRHLEELEELKSHFLAASSHELKTPLTIVQSYLEILTSDLSEGLSEQQLAFVQIAHEAVLRLRHLVSDLVDLAALESGQIPLNIQRVEIASLVRRVVEEMQPMAAKAGVTLTARIPERVGAVRADPQRILQVLQNLTDNALKYTQTSGSVALEIGQKVDTVDIRVCDTGAGIPAEKLPYIFDPFVRGERTASGERAGSGLGLAICQRIMSALGGKLQVDSLAGQGSVFSASLPRWPEEEGVDDDRAALQAP